MKHKITKDEFAKEYAQNSGMSVEEVLKTQIVLPCTCDYEGCPGWAMVSKNPLSIETHQNLYDF